MAAPAFHVHAQCGVESDGDQPVIARMGNIENQSLVRFSSGKAGFALRAKGKLNGAGFTAKVSSKQNAQKAADHDKIAMSFPVAYPCGATLFFIGQQLQASVDDGIVKLIEW